MLIGPVKTITSWGKGGVNKTWQFQQTLNPSQACVCVNNDSKVTYPYAEAEKKNNDGSN